MLLAHSYYCEMQHKAALLVFIAFRNDISEYDSHDTQVYCLNNIFNRTINN